MSAWWPAVHSSLDSTRADSALGIPGYSSTTTDITARPTITSPRAMDPPSRRRSTPVITPASERLFRRENRQILLAISVSTWPTTLVFTAPLVVLPVPTRTSRRSPIRKDLWMPMPVVKTSSPRTAALPFPVVTSRSRRTRPASAPRSSPSSRGTTSYPVTAASSSTSSTSIPKLAWTATTTSTTSRPRLYHPLCLFIRASRATNRPPISTIRTKTSTMTPPVSCFRPTADPF